MNKRIESNKLKVDGYTTDQSLCCPVCGDNNGLHIVRVDVGTNKNNTSVTSGGTFISNAGHNGRWRRGSKTTLKFRCEMCLHVSEISFGFHKSQIMVDLCDLGSNPDKNDKDIWRD